MPPIRARRRWPISRRSGLRNEMNYLVVLENIDPQDWARPGADVILQRIKQQRRDGSIILLHDAGGDRSQTIEALAADHRLAADKRRHDRAVEHAPRHLARCGHAAGRRCATPARDSCSSAGFRVFHATEEFLWAFMIVATALIVLRTLIVIYLAARFRSSARADAGFSHRR